VLVKGRAKDLQLVDGGFEVTGRPYSDSLIQHIFVGTSTKRDFNGVRLTLTLTTGEQLVFQETEGTGLISAVYQEVFHTGDLGVIRLHEKANTLKGRTYQQRLSYYLAELNDKRYFTYGGCQFHPFQKIVFKGREFCLKATDFERCGTAVVMRPTHSSVFDRLKREFSFRTPPQFNTQTDSDVILQLLRQYFGLKL